jgi:hypothetical protein
MPATKVVRFAEHPRRVSIKLPKRKQKRTMRVVSPRSFLALKKAFLKEVAMRKKLQKRLRKAGI